MKILITGASGSIGREIVNQLIQDNEIICFDRNEEKVFYLEKEIREKYPESKFTVCLGDITNHQRLQQVFDEQKPEMVYHTAANKHVPLGESNVHEFVHNNIFGTINVATLCMNYKVPLIFISTDKAVEPVSVMGHTKRLCEKYLLGLSFRYDTRIVVCRFGNIIGSSGSVYELFEKQGKEGTIKVTHPDMERYFIKPEKAVSNLIKCSKLESGLYTFNMGDPVKIYDVAMAYAFEYNAKIEITGLRPGEKIKEKLKHDKEVFEELEKDILQILTPYSDGQQMLEIYLLAGMSKRLTVKGILEQFKKLNG